MQEEFEKWFWRVIDPYLLESLEKWQLERVKELSFKAYKKK